MSMADALRRISNAPWLRGTVHQPVVEKPPTLLQEMETLIRMAATNAQIDRQSGTWIAVSSWAANELLETFAQQESATTEKSSELRARARVLRELLSFKERDKVVVRFADSAPLIP